MKPRLKGLFMCFFFSHLVCLCAVCSPNPTQYNYYHNLDLLSHLLELFV